MDRREFDLGDYVVEPREETAQPTVVDPFLASTRTIAGRQRRPNIRTEPMMTRSRTVQSASPPDEAVLEEISECETIQTDDIDTPATSINMEPVIEELIPEVPPVIVPVSSRQVEDDGELGSCVSLQGIEDVQRLYENNPKVLKMGYNSITGLQAVEWVPSGTVGSNLRWFENIRQRQRIGRALARFNPQQNLIVEYNYSTACQGNAVNVIRGEEVVILTRLRAAAAQDISVEFTAATKSTMPISDLFTKYYRGLMIDEKYIASDIQGVLRVSKNLAGFLTPAITVGVGDSALATFYTIGWTLFIHRAWFALLEVAPVLPAIANDAMNMIGLSVVAAECENTAREIVHAIEAGNLVILSTNYSLMQLAVLRLICNGLPRFAAPADAARLSILDNFITPRFNLTVLHHGAAPVLPQIAPTCYAISQTLLYHAVLTASNDDCLAGLVRACAVCFYHNGAGDVNCLVNAFCEYRRLAWPMPRFRNPFYEWLKLHDQTLFAAERHELTEAMVGPLIDIYRSFVVTNMAISVASGTVFHRWSIPANILQLYITNEADAAYGNGSIFLRYRMVAKSNRVVANFFSMVYMVIKDLCHDSLPFKAFHISAWNSGLGIFDLPIEAGHGWVGGWDRQIVYPCQPYTVLWAFEEWPSIWGYLAAPITLSINVERDTVSRNADARFSVTRGDDLFMTRIKDGAFFFSTGYSTAVLSAISQNCRVAAWNRPEFLMFDRTQREDGLLPATSVEPALVYDAPARLVKVGTMWHYDWNRQQGFGLRWNYDDLPERVRVLVEFKSIHLLMAGVSSSGHSLAFTIEGHPGNLDVVDDYDLETAPSKKAKSIEDTLA